MWGRLDNFAKIRGHLGEALEKVKKEVDDAVDKLAQESQNDDTVDEFTSEFQYHIERSDDSEPLDFESSGKRADGIQGIEATDSMEIEFVPTDSTAESPPKLKSKGKEEKASESHNNGSLTTVDESSLPDPPAEGLASRTSEQESPTAVAENAEEDGEDSMPQSPDVASQIKTEKSGHETVDETDGSMQGRDCNAQNSMQDANTVEDGVSSAVQLEERVLNMDMPALLGELRLMTSTLEAREHQLERQAEQMAELREVHAQLQAKNEQLVLKAAKVSEEDMEDLRAEFEQRLAASERKVYALTKERDALKRGSEKLSSTSELLKEKDEIIQQVMEEGEKLSKKQLELETALRKRKAQVQELEGDNESLRLDLSAEVAKCEQLSLEKAALVRNLQSSEEQQKGQLEVQRNQFEALLLDARAAQDRAEEAAEKAAKEGLTKRIQEAESQIQMLSETNEELQRALEKQRIESEDKERQMKQEITGLERKYQNAESRHEELAAKFPEATQPLVRQLESLQSDMNARIEAWTLAENSMMEQLEEAESLAGIAQERERMASRRLQFLQEHCSSLENTVDELRAELDASVNKCAEQETKLDDAGTRVEELRAQLSSLEADLKTERHKAEQVAKQHEEERLNRQSAEQQAKVLQADYEGRLRDLQAQLDSPTGMVAVNGVDVWESTPQDDPINMSATANLALEGDDVERLKSLVKLRQREFDRMSKQIQTLEKTRERLSGELVAESQKASQAEIQLIDLRVVKQQFEELQGRYSACVELLGEREERLAEVEADLLDIKELYKDQISLMAEQLAVAKSGSLD